MRLDGRQHAPDYSLAVHRPLDLRTNDEIALQSLAELAQQRRRRCGAGSRQLVQLAHRQAEWSEVAREDPDAFLLAWRVQLYLQVEASPDCCVQPVAMVGRSNHEAFVSIETLQEDIHDAVHFALGVARIALPLLRQRLKLAGSPLSPEAALASLRRIQRHSVSIDNGAPVSGISSINQDQAATMAALKVKKLSNELQLSLL